MGPDENKIVMILKVVEDSGKKGIWIRELSRKTSIPFTTVHLYIHKHMKDKVSIEDMEFGLAKSGKFKVVRLKKFAG